jgi:hypothetical protein
MQTGIAVDSITFGTMGDDGAVEAPYRSRQVLERRRDHLPDLQLLPRQGGRIAEVQVHGRPARRGPLLLGDVQPQAIPDRLG